MGADVSHPVSEPLLTLYPLHGEHSPPFLLKRLGRGLHKSDSSYPAPPKETDCFHDQNPHP